MALPGMLPDPREIAEWPGAVSSKFRDKFTGLPLCRKKVSCHAAAGDATSLARNGFGKFFNDREGLAICQGRRFIPDGYGETYQWRPCKRQLSEPGILHIEKREGKANVEAPPTRVFNIPERRHVRQVESKQEYGDLPVAKGTVLRENGIRAAEQPAREVDLTVEMQRKARNQELDVKRNGIGCRSLGDKNYRHPEYMSRFFHSGEMVVGSSFHRGMHAKTEPRNSNTVHIEMDHRPPAKTYMQKQREKALQEAEAEVEDLTLRWEADTLKECDEGYLEPSDSEEEPEAAAA
ncbi:Putative E3 ubiquitin-protein ligase HERC1 [Durusdinium trenchii]